MQGIIFIGIQGSGKSTYYKENYFNSHIRISMDLLKTRNRESKLMDLCLETQAKLVVDNTNPLIIDRRRYIEKLKEKKYEIIGFYFNANVEQALILNKKRPEKEIVPDVGIKSTYKRMELPTYSEGYDKLYYVKIEDAKFKVEEWNNDI